MPQFSTQTVTKQAEPAALSTLTLGFAGDPVIRWVLSDPDRYFGVFPDVVRAFGGRVFAHGSADMAAECCGVALWLPPETEPDFETLEHLMAENGSPQALEVMDEVFERMGAAHPDERFW